MPSESRRVFLFLTAVVSLSVLGVAGIIGLTLIRQGNVADSTPLITAILGFLAPTVVSLLTLMRLEKNTELTEQTKRQVDSGKLDEHNLLLEDALQELRKSTLSIDDAARAAGVIASHHDD